MSLEPGLDGAVRVFLGLGSNLGDRTGHLATALEMLSRPPFLGPCRASSCYETEPVGSIPQGPYLNLVAEVFTRLEPHALLALLKQHEREAGRVAGERWGPRPIDLDILLYGERVIDTPDLRIPHAELKKRAFVLVPMAELEPGLRIPGEGRTVAELLEGRADRAGVVYYSPAPVSLSGMM